MKTYLKTSLVLTLLILMGWLFISSLAESRQSKSQTDPVVVLRAYYPIVGTYDPDFFPDERYFDSKGVINDSKKGTWLHASNGNVSVNSVVYKYIDGKPVYRCRTVTSINNYYGVLIPGRGCYVKGEVSTTFNKEYATLVAY